MPSMAGTGFVVQAKGTVGPVTIRPMVIEDIPLAQAIGKAAWSKVASDDLGREVDYPIRPTKIVRLPSRRSLRLLRRIARQ